MTTAQVESMRDAVARHDWDIWQTEKAVHELLEQGRAAMMERDYVTAETFLDAAKDIAHWLDENLHAWEREFQAVRLPR